MNAEATEIARLRGIITKLVEAGRYTSNCCYNLSQRQGRPLTEADCTTMKEAYALWDTAAKHARPARPETTPPKDTP